MPYHFLPFSNYFIFVWEVAQLQDTYILQVIFSTLNYLEEIQFYEYVLMCWDMIVRILCVFSNFRLVLQVSVLSHS